MIESDVVIIGCGPTGSTLGLLLRARGLSVSILEKDHGVYALPRAIMMDDEMRRVYLGLGLEAEIDELVTPMLGAEFVDSDFNRLVGIDLPPGTLGHQALPPSQAYYQPELDAFLRRKASEAGVEIVLGSQVTGLRDLATDADFAVEVDVAGQPGARARWVVGCDGAASATRRWRNIGFDDLGFDQDWLVVDTKTIRPDVELPTIAQQRCDVERPSTFVPGHQQHRRWEFQLQPGETAADMERPERIFELIEPWGVAASDVEIQRATVYRFHATVAEAMRDGSVFLAGDAAHQMPPFLGQGLCSGIRDASNLAWKLHLVEAGRAGDALLDTYGAERALHAAAVVEHACDTGRLIDQMAGRVDSGIDRSAAYGGGRPFPILRGGVLTGDDPVIGRLAPQTLVDGAYSDTRLGSGFAIVLADERLTVPRSWDDLSTTIVVEPALAAGHRAMVVRPDKYVAAVADDQSDLDAVTAELMTAMGR